MSTNAERQARWREKRNTLAKLAEQQAEEIKTLRAEVARLKGLLEMQQAKPSTSKTVTAPKRADAAGAAADQASRKRDTSERARLNKQERKLKERIAKVRRLANDRAASAGEKENASVSWLRLQTMLDNVREQLKRLPPKPPKPVYKARPLADSMAELIAAKDARDAKRKKRARK